MTWRDDEHNPADSAADGMGAAISEVIQKEGSAMVTRWIVLAEVISEDGNQSFWSLASDGLPVWDAIGMLDFALTNRRQGLERE